MTARVLDTLSEVIFGRKQHTGQTPLSCVTVFLCPRGANPFCLTQRLTNHFVLGKAMSYCHQNVFRDTYPDPVVLPLRQRVF